MAHLDFFERQEAARRRTKLLTVYFILGVIGTVLLTYVAAALLVSVRTTGNLWDPKLFLIVVVATLGVIVGGSFFKIAQLSSGGSAVATMLGGQPVDANTSDLDERKFLNIVEEMAIAAGTPVPQVYILPNESGINAFAAGHSTSDMVVCATRGALQNLTRDELQGVIGHEFSHILNGDMRLNLRLMGMIFGLLCLAVFGRILLYTRGRKNSLPAFGIALLVIGSIGVFFGKLIKSAVSRQREFLADASAVQFTRNPQGLANALKKVGGCGSRIEDPNAEDASHFFFANGLSESIAGMFSTHPPLEDRIRALDPNWDGKFISVDLAVEDNAPNVFSREPARPVRPAPFGNFPGGGGGAFGVLGAGALLSGGPATSRHLEYAADWRANLSPALDQAAREPMSAVALIYALLLSRDDALRTQQLAELQTRAAPGICQATVNLFSSVVNLDTRARMPLAALTMTALRQLSPAQYNQFAKNIKYIIESDQQIELFEYTIQKIVLRQLEPNFMPPARPVVQFYVIKPLVNDCAILLSALAHVGQSEPTAIQKTFRQGAIKLNLPDLPLLSPAECELAKIDAALNRLNQATPLIKKLVLNACAETVAADGVIQQNEAELLRAIADTLDCPIPPLVTL